MTSVRMEVARLVFSNAEMARTEGIPNHIIERVSSEHQMSGLQRLRELAKEFRCTHSGWKAYEYRNNRYYFFPAFIRWTSKLCREEAKKTMFRQIRKAA